MSLAVIVTLSALGSGCSDHETSTVPKQRGNLADPQYLVAGAVFRIADSILTGDVEQAVRRFENITGRLPLPGNTPIYHPLSGYWFVSNSGIDTVRAGDRIIDTRPFRVDDSMQFLAGIQTIQFPESLFLTQIQTGVTYYAIGDSSGDTLTIEHHVRLVASAGVIWAMGEVALDGGGRISGRLRRTIGLDGAQAECRLGFSIVTSLDKLRLNLAAVIDSNKCPTDGAMVHSGKMDSECIGVDSVEVNGNWVLRHDFAGTQVDTDVENATTFWSTREPCVDIWPFGAVGAGPDADSHPTSTAQGKGPASGSYLTSRE